MAGHESFACTSMWRLSWRPWVILSGLLISIDTVRIHGLPPLISFVIVTYTPYQQITTLIVFTITAEILERSLANFDCQYADGHMNLNFMRCVNERERTICHRKKKKTI